MTDNERHEAEIRSIMKITGIITPQKEKKVAEKPAKKAKKEEK